MIDVKPALIVFPYFVKVRFQIGELMKVERRAWRLLRHGEMQALPNEESPDSIPSLSVLRCPLCGAAYRAGRWKWEAAPDDAIEEPCPACNRIRNDQPGGQVLLKGQFSEARCNDLLQLLKRTEEHEKAEHPLERTMSITPMDGSLLVATTGRHLARCIGEALYASYSGQVEYHYRESDGMVQVVWSR